MREKLGFNDNWRFHRGDIATRIPLKKGPMYKQAKTQSELWGPAAVLYNDRSEGFACASEMCTDLWVTVDLPHDYIIEQQPSKENNETLGFFKYENAWYRKHFKLTDEDRTRRITVYFEGIATRSVVYINGVLAARNFCGYTSFEADITDHVLYDRDNVLAVYVDTSKHEGWWYEGAGIYRNVWLIKTADISVDLHGVYVCPVKFGDESWRVPVETIIRNDGNTQRKVILRSEITDPAGSCIVSDTVEAFLKPYSKTTVKTEMSVVSPRLWDVDDPNVYKLKTVLIADDQKEDETETRFGFRTIRFDPDRGFFLNERNVLIKGVCCHQDHGLTGKAVPPRVERYKIKLLKSMGANAYRTSHYPHSENTMQTLSDTGFLVMDETRWFNSNEFAMNELEFLVKRDRNEPCVICWSIANEEPVTLTDCGLKIARKMKQKVRELDPSRPVTAAISDDPVNNRIISELDLIGVNYNLKQYDEIHKLYPDKPVIASECCATGSTRGWYLDDCPERGYINAFDHDSTSWFASRERTWKHITERSWVAGCFQWIGIDHRGETVWPRLCSQSGAIDLYLQKKDAFYQNKAYWTDEPMIHLLPHWNHEGREGEEIVVRTYTNCDHAELYLSGRLIGKQAIERSGHGEWKVLYEPGILTAKGYIGDKIVCQDTVETSGKPYALNLRLEDEGVGTNDHAILSCICVDEAGRFVPDASPCISFYSSGPCRIIATGSDVSDPIPPGSPDRKMRAGLCSLIAATGNIPGKIKFYAHSNGLRPARLEIDIKSID